MKRTRLFPVLLSFALLSQVSPIVQAESVILHFTAPSPDLLFTNPPGLTQATHQYVNVPWKGALDPELNDGVGIRVSLHPGYGLTMYGPAIETGDGLVRVDCSINMTDSPVAVSLGVLDARPGQTLADIDGSMGTNQLASGADFVNKWNTVEVFYDPKGNAVIPVVQLVSLLENGTIQVYIDNLRVTPLRDLDPSELPDAIHFPGPFPTPSPTPTRPPEVPSENWRSQSYSIPYMTGEMRVNLVDIDKDSDQDILLSNSGPRDQDPSFLILKQVAPNAFSSPEPLLRRSWVPGLHEKIAQVPGSENLLLDVMATGRERYQFAPVLRIFDLAHTWYSANAYRPSDEYGLYPTTWEPLTDFVRARVHPFALSPVSRDPGSSDKRVQCVVSTCMYRPSAYPGRYVSILNELFVHPNGDIERGRVLNTADLFKDIDFVVTSLAIGDDGRVFVLAESLTSAESSESGYIHRTTLFEWTAGSSFLPRFTWWKEEHGGNLLAVDLDGVTLNPDGTSTPVHPPKELVVRFGNTVKVFRTDSDVLNEIWSGYLPAPLEPGAYLLGHTEEKDFLTSNPDGPLSMTFQGELIPGNLDADGNPDLLSYSDGLRVLPGNGDGKFSDYYAIDPNFSPTNACLGDVDGNGTNEILAVRGNELRIYVHTPNASFPTIPTPLPGGQVTTLAGEFLNMEAGQSGVRGVEFQQARRLAVGADRIFVSDTEGNCVLSRPEGQGWQILNDANSNLLDLSSPMGLLFTDNRLLICDSGHHRILSYYPNTGETTLIAGTGEEGNTGDGGPAIHAAFSYPCDLAAMPDGRLVIADTGNNRLRILDPYTGIIDNLLPADSQLQLIEPVAVESDGTGALFVAESSRCRVRRFFQQNGTWQVEMIAGGSCGEETPNLPVGSALMFPEDLALMPDGSLLIADTGNQRILRYSGGSNEWLAGSGVLGYVYENLPLRVFHFDAPSGFGIVSESELLVADGRSIRRLQIGEAGPGSPDLPRPGDLPQATPIPIPSPTLSPTPIPVDQYLIGPVYYEENGHYYAFARQKLSWTASSEFAASRFDGSGYLATITSSSENGFLIAFLKTMASLYLLDGAWLGGYQDPDLDESTSASYAQGWHWVTDEPWVYANWAEDEPDDSLNADNLCFCTSRTEYWDDRPGTQIRYSVIEWDHDPRMQPTGTATRTPITRPTETPTATPSVTPTRTPTPSLTPTPQGKPTHRPGITVEIPGLPSDAIPLEMVLIPAGTFLMGSQPDERGRSSDEAQHQVTISQDFYIGKYEITQAQWRAVMKSNPSTNVTGGSHPVESVSWNDCQTFIQTLNQMRPESAEKFRLPTEAEWEYACRERTTTRFYWGDDLNETEIGKHAWYTGNSPSITQRVGRKIPNAWGLYDMNGNVWEWCHDLYGSYPSGLAVDLMCEQPGDTKYVIRGGSCSCPARLCRSACRLKTGFVGPDVGFRVVLSSLTP